jgi:hypothetical protein
MENLPGILRELSQHTSVKWWTDPEGNSWVHVKNYAKWNTGLRKDRMGKDKLPSWPGAETEKAGEVEVEGEVGSLSISISRRVVPANAGTTPGVVPEQMKNGNEEKAHSESKVFTYPEDFERFWKAYPKKRAKRNAYREWLKLRPRPDLEVLLAAIERLKKSGRELQFYKDPERWLKGACWEDEVEPPKECPYQNFNDPNYHMPGDPEWTTQSKLQR